MKEEIEGRIGSSDGRIGCKKKVFWSYKKNESWILCLKFLKATFLFQFLIHLCPSTQWACDHTLPSALALWFHGYFWKNPLLSEPNDQSLYGHCWWIPTSAHLVNWDIPSALLSLSVRVLIRASGNQKTDSMVTDRKIKRKRPKVRDQPKDKRNTIIPYRYRLKMVKQKKIKFT